MAFGVRVVKWIATASFGLCGIAGAFAQTQGLNLPYREPINVGWFPKTVSYAPDESDLIVTACTDTWRVSTPQRCNIARYRFDTQRWERLPDLNPDADYEDVAYTWNGDAIFAQERARCEVKVPAHPEQTYCNHLVLLDLKGKKLNNLTQQAHNVYTWPSLTRDGKKILYWGISDQLDYGMGGGAWDVKELDIASQVTTQKTDYQAAWPKVTPRYMPDGKRLMLVAEEYPKRPNGKDYLMPEPNTGVLREVYYVSKFGRNMTVVVDGPRATVLPYFPSNEHMWLMVRDISRDDTLAVFDRQGFGMCFRFVNEPLRTEECFSKTVAYTPSVSISASKKTVAVVNGARSPNINWHIEVIDVVTGLATIIGMRL